jgi:hypothetical protein
MSIPALAGGRREWFEFNGNLAALREAIPWGLL